MVTFGGTGEEILMIGSCPAPSWGYKLTCTREAGKRQDYIPVSHTESRTRPPPTRRGLSSISPKENPMPSKFPTEAS